MLWQLLFTGKMTLLAGFCLSCMSPVLKSKLHIHVRQKTQMKASYTFSSNTTVKHVGGGVMIWAWCLYLKDIFYSTKLWSQPRKHSSLRWSIAEKQKCSEDSSQSLMYELKGKEHRCFKGPVSPKYNQSKMLWPKHQRTTNLDDLPMTSKEMIDW